MDKILATIGEEDASIEYIDRPTVKVIVEDKGKILILNGGLLPGGGADYGESDLEAIYRELTEELGATVSEIRPLGTIIQFRNILSRRYVITGYVASLNAFNKETTPQDEGEAAFVPQWVSFDDAKKIIKKSITEVSQKDMSDDANQGRLYNLMTSREFIIQKQRETLSCLSSRKLAPTDVTY